MQILKTYDLKLVTFILGAIPISGYGEDGGIEFESGADIGTPTVGAVGDSVFSRSNNHSALVTVTVGEWTRSYRDLALIMQTQQAIPGALLPLNLLVLDPLNGDRFSDPWAAFVQRPLPNKGAVAGERSFQLFCPNLFHPANSNFGSLNLI